MARRGIEHQVTEVLAGINVLGGYVRSLVCTEDGLLVAHAGGDPGEGHDIAAFTSLFDTVVERATRDIGMAGVDEVTLLDATDHRLVIRPLPLPRKPRMFLVVWMDRGATWRRNTTAAVGRLVPLLDPLLEPPNLENQETT